MPPDRGAQRPATGFLFCCTAFLLLATTAGRAAMPTEYRIVERYYGPHIRFRDWHAEDGGIENAGGALHIFADPTARVRRADYPHGGGGDRLLVLQFSADRFDDESMVTVHFNAPRRKRDVGGFAIAVSADSVRAFVRDSLLGTAPPLDLTADCAHSVSLLTLGNQFEIRVDGKILASGTMPPPFTDNEGWTVILSERAHTIVHTFEEAFVAHPTPPTTWVRTERLYHETFGTGSSANWIVNTGNPDSGMEMGEDHAVFRHMSNSFLRQRFRGPLAVDCVVTPVPTGEFTAGVTDAIVIWMIDQPGRDFAGLLEKR